MYAFDNAEIQPSSTTLFVKANQYFYLCGHFDVEVVHGECYLDGVQLMSGVHHVEQPVYSPAHSFVCTVDSTLRFTPLECSFPELYQLPPSTMSLKSVSADCLLSKNAFPFGGVLIVNESSVMRKMVVPSNWRRICRRIFNTCTEGPLRMMVVGAKGVGKSLFTNILTNTLVRSNKVCVLDMDPGQPLSGKVGCLSLLVYEDQMFSESFIQNKEVSGTHYVFGSNNIGINIPLYLKIFEEMIMTYNAQFSGLPMIVNTGGWVNGLGADLLLSMMKMADIQLTIDITQNDKLTIREKATPLYVAVKSMSSVPTHLPNIFTPQTRRFYMQKTQFIGAEWYQIPLNGFCLQYTGEFDNHFALCAIHQQHVFLAHNNEVEQDIKNNATEYPVFNKISEIEITETYGVGLAVVDHQARGLLLLTSVSADIMENVNTLMFSPLVERPNLPAVRDGSVGAYMAFDQDISGQSRSQFKFVRRHFE